MNSPDEDRTRTEAEALEEPDHGATSDSAEPGAGPVQSVAPREVEEERSGETLGRFRLTKKLGEGGMGVVYAAEDRSLGRTVALKILSRKAVGREDRRKRFLREARAASSVLHPNIAAIFEVGEERGEVFLAMEHVAGRTLRKVLREAGGPLGVGRAIAIAREIATGLGKAHAAEIVHRDLKPENVMITPEGQVKILDFGLAKRLSREDEQAASPTADLATVEGQILGTAGYMSPEQALGQAVDVRTDLFSLGVILYEMLTGVRPFVGGSLVATLIATHREPAAPPSQRNSDVPKEVDALVLRCLEKAPEARFQSAEELGEALSEVSVKAPARGSAPRGSVSRDSVSRGSVSREAETVADRRAPFASRTKGVVIAGLVGVSVGIVVLWSRGWTATANGTLGAATATATNEPGVVVAPRRPCSADDAGKKACSGGDSVAWCDMEGRNVGCCGKGLVPKGADGICVCPPGGTAVASARSRGCDPVPGDFEDRYAKAKGEAMNRAIACFQPDKARSSISGGRFEAEYYLTPEGEVFGARVHHTTTPDDAGQACAVAALRAIRFPPPAGEDAGKKQGFGFVFKD